MIKNNLSSIVKKCEKIIIEQLEIRKEMKDVFKEDPTLSGCSLLELATITTSYQNTQEYSPKITKRIKNDFRFKSIKKEESSKTKDSEGDCLDKEEAIIELKVALLDINGTYSILQIRPNHLDIEYYLITFINTTSSKVWHCKIPSEEVYEYAFTHGASAHGKDTSKNRALYTHERRISIRESDHIFKKWTSKEYIVSKETYYDVDS